jgi:hypothetical protein
MKKTILALVLVSGLAILWACQKTKDQVNEATEFTIDYSTTLSLPASSVIVNSPVDFSTPDIPTTSSTRFASEKTTKELIDEIVLSKFNISTTGANLNFLKSLTISIKASGLPDLAVASKTLIPSGVTSVSADLTNTNIKEYIFKDNIQFKLSVTVSTSLSATQDLKLDQSVTVKGKKIN